MLDPTVMLMRSRRVRFKRMGNGSNGERGQIVKKRVLQTTYKTQTSPSRSNARGLQVLEKEEVDRPGRRSRLS